ncbi:Inner membrane protein YjgN [Alteripontixanthobacter maritimus]|uniref:Inner membrane protein YjgN n=1 Tax=Alteripontixanthobacter maritimus TaxID=2161824 RepID=A0A369Q9W4_9SPHN|nr:YjgN family protein [Alteripontixanthobacter maritimus]RDC61262.1 Inner membrane protein YjgN [Alteripontixanthobacter maritimus]
MDEQRQDAESAFGFEGAWQEYAPIAFTNLLLTIVTLGIYRFWATARTRRYLWSRSRFVDEPLEWAGTGMELFIGALLVLGLIGLPFFLSSFATQALAMRGYEAAAVLLQIAVLVAVFYLVGVAVFRGLRYRLSRTRWRGIRGGSDDAGFGYGFSYMWKTVAGYIPLGLAVPWSMTSLWNERWNTMSFGPHKFEANAEYGNIFARYLLFYLAPFVFVILAILFGATGALAGFGVGGQDGGLGGTFFGIFLGVIFAYLALGLIAMAFYAKYFREVVGSTRWHKLQFHFNASTMDWFKLLIGDILLVVFTLGIGAIFLTYRHWKFFMIHMDASGEIVLDELTQSTTRTAGHGEGLLDSFDMGAI